MSDNVTEFPVPKPVEFMIGFFSEWRVQIDGRIIPHLTAYKDGERIALVVDHRFSNSFAKEDAYQAAWLIAQAIAVGAGYTHLGADSKDQPFAPLGVAIERPQP